MSVPHDAGLVASVRARLDAGLVARTDIDADITAAVRTAARRLAPLMESPELAQLERRVHSDIVGLGPLDEMLADPDVQEVMVNRGREVWIDVRGALHRVATLDPRTTEVLIERILRPLGRRLDRRSPTVDARLPDGSRVCAAIPPVSPDGPTLSIRRFAVQPVPLEAFAGEAVVELLHTVVRARCNLLVSGATSSGKTTLLNAIAGLLPHGERVITLEDTAELRLPGAHVVRLEAREASPDGVPAVGLDHLLRTALRLRPDRLVVGEVRGAEAVTLVQAMGTGHDGSFATLHANDAADALRRLDVLVVQGAPAWPLTAVREQIHASLDVVVHVARGADGARRIVEVAEVAPHDAPSRLRTLALHDTVMDGLGRRRDAT